MAKITPGPLVSRISGSVGGTTFAHNRGGAYARARVIPTDPNTTFQQSRRAILSAQSQGWSARTDAERAAWSNWSKQNPVTDVLGASILLSGHQAYVKLNSRLDLDDATLLTVPPIIKAPLALDTLIQDGDIGLGDVDMAFTATPLAAGVKLWILAAVVNSAGITYVKNLLRFIGTSAAAETSPFDNEALITAKFGTLVVGQTLHVRAGTFDTANGQLSVGHESKVVITTT